jgi:flavin reductase (DIM6/NTAB) family NADH-FMN oxidoreductase RutF
MLARMLGDWDAEMKANVRAGAKGGANMVKTQQDPVDGLLALPGFPLVLVTVARNVMTAAAFSFYSFRPPCVMVGIRPQTWTFSLIWEKGEFGINLPTAGQLEAVRLCGSVSGREGDKFPRAGLTPQPGTVIDSVLVAECPLSLECQVVHEVEHGGTHRWFVGEIVAAHMAEGYTRDQALLYWPGEYRAVGAVLLET